MNKTIFPKHSKKGALIKHVETFSNFIDVTSKCKLCQQDTPSKKRESPAGCPFLTH